MHRPPTLLALVLTAVLAAAAGARAQTPEPLYDPSQLPAFHGRLQLFTLTPRGDIDGFILADGTEVKTPPHLTAALAKAVKPGDAVTVHGLKAASLPLIQAMSVGNDTTGAVVVDNGPTPDRVAPPLPETGGEAVVLIRGRLRQLLRGPRGDINGALLDDGTVLKLPPPEAARYADVLIAGHGIVAEGIRHTLPVGTIVELTALGAEGEKLQPVARAPRPGPPPGAPPPG